MTAMTSPTKTRIDQLLVERGLAESREKAQALIIAGEVVVNGQKALKPGHSVAADSRVEVLRAHALRQPWRLQTRGRVGSLGAGCHGMSLPGRGRVHRRFHGLPAAARRREGLGHRCRPRPNRLEIPQRRARSRARRRQRALSDPGGLSLRSSTSRCATPASSPSLC